MTEVWGGDAVSTDLHRPSSTRVVLGRQMSLRVRLSKSCWLDRYLRVLQDIRRCAVSLTHHP